MSGLNAGDALVAYPAVQPERRTGDTSASAVNFMVELPLPTVHEQVGNHWPRDSPPRASLPSRPKRMSQPPVSLPSGPEYNAPTAVFIEDARPESSILATWMKCSTHDGFRNASGVSYAACLIVVAALTVIMGSGTVASQSAPVVDPRIPVLLEAGRVRVLVELRAGDATDRVDAIAKTQDRVLVRLPANHAAVTRRYATIPMLALEIDRTALEALEMMGDVVIGVKPDLTAPPQ
jgi:hypothetical protein